MHWVLGRRHCINKTYSGQHLDQWPGHLLWWWYHGVLISAQTIILWLNVSLFMHAHHSHMCDDSDTVIFYQDKICHSWLREGEFMNSDYESWMLASLWCLKSVKSIPHCSWGKLHHHPSSAALVLLLTEIFYYTRVLISRLVVTMSRCSSRHVSLGRGQWQIVQNIGRHTIILFAAETSIDI